MYNDDYDADYEKQQAEELLQMIEHKAASYGPHDKAAALVEYCREDGDVTSILEYFILGGDDAECQRTVQLACYAAAALEIDLRGWIDLAEVEISAGREL